MCWSWQLAWSGWPEFWELKLQKIQRAPAWGRPFSTCSRGSSKLPASPQTLPLAFFSILQANNVQQWLLAQKERKKERTLLWRILINDNISIQLMTTVLDILDAKSMAPNNLFANSPSDWSHMLLFGGGMGRREWIWEICRGRGYRAKRLPYVLQKYNAPFYLKECWKKTLKN